MKKAGAAIGMMVMALSSIGCAYSHLRFTREGGNPPFSAGESSYPEDGFERDGIVRICFDRDGNLYPDPAAVAIDDAKLESCRHSLREYFGAGFDFDAVAAELGGRLNKLAAGKMVMLLVHGINSSYPESRRSYHATRLAIRDRYPELEAVFVEVYWDGMRGDPLALWAQARETSKWAGLSLRPLLGALDRRVAVRAVTHSRGAAVVCSAFWDLPLRGSEESDRAFAERQGKVAAPELDDVCLGLVAPAIGEEEFERAGGVRLVVGVNEDDPALGKGPLPASWFGSTRLGCSLEACGSIEGAEAVDLSGAEAHEFKDYVLRKKFLGEFLGRVVGVKE
jgi:hypothetical protein